MDSFFKTLPIDPKDDPIKMGMYHGYYLAAPKSFWDADQELIDSIAGGCGPGGNGDMFVPDTMYGLSVKAACSVHDWMYAVWNTPGGFEMANKVFKNNMIRIIDQSDSFKWLKVLRKRRALKYFLAVHYFGETSYFDSHLQYV